jgi:hypothetical protein
MWQLTPPVHAKPSIASTIVNPTNLKINTIIFSPHMDIIQGTIQIDDFYLVGAAAVRGACTVGKDR